MFGLVPILLSVEVMLLCLTSCVEVMLLERGVVYFYFAFAKSSVEVPCVEVLCGRIVEILLCESGDVELWLESRNIS